MWPPRTVVITDRARLEHPLGSDWALRDFVRAVAEAGADVVQLRERDWSDATLLRATRDLCAAVQGTGCKLIVNERAHVAWAAGADGVHLRSSGMPPARLRRVQPGSQLIGRSVHAGDVMSTVDGADYVHFGTVFASRSKPVGASLAGLPALADWTARPGMVPVVAVGGIDLARCADVRAAGACGVAGIDLFVTAYARGEAALRALVGDIHAVFADGERAE